MTNTKTETLGEYYRRVQGGWPAQWPQIDTSTHPGEVALHVDEYGRQIATFSNGEQWSFQSWADDYLPLLT